MTSLLLFPRERFQNSAFVNIQSRKQSENELAGTQIFQGLPFRKKQ